MSKGFFCVYIYTIFFRVNVSNKKNYQKDDELSICNKCINPFRYTKINYLEIIKSQDIWPKLEKYKCLKCNKTSEELSDYMSKYGLFIF